MTLRIDELPLGTAESGDWLEFQDVSDTTDRPEGTSKRLNASDLLGGGGTAKFSVAPNIVLAKLAAINSAVIETGSTYPRIEFDDTTPQSIELMDNLVVGLGPGAIRCSLDLAMAAATTGTVRFNVSIWAINDGDSTQVTNYDTDNSTGDITVAGTAGTRFSHDFELTNKSTITEGSLLAVRIERDATADTATDKAWLLKCRVYEA